MKLKKKVNNKFHGVKPENVKNSLNVLRVIKNVVCWILIIILSFSVITFLLTRFSGGTPTIFGYSMQRVDSGSMEPELQVGDVILSKEVDEITTLKVGDIITFNGEKQFGMANVTHRIVVAPYVENGVVLLQTKGDANEIEDDIITEAQVKSVLVRKLVLAKNIFNLFLSPWGLIIFIALLLFVFFDELLNIVRIATGNYPDEKEESISEIIERIQREDREKEDEKKRLAEKKSRDLTNIMSYRASEEDAETSDNAEENDDDRPEE